MIRDQIGKDPSVFLPNNIGRLIKGWAVIETKKDTKDAYRNGTESNVKPKFLRNAKNKKSVIALIAIKTDNPTPIFVGIEWRSWRFEMGF